MHVFAVLAAIVLVFFPAAQSIAQLSPALAPPEPEDVALVHDLIAFDVNY